MKKSERKKKKKIKAVVLAFKRMKQRKVFARIGQYLTERYKPVEKSMETQSPIPALLKKYRYERTSAGRVYTSPIGSKEG
jgi:hypothetical protein